MLQKTGPALKLLRRNAVCASCVVLTIVSIIGVCYWITVQLELAARGLLVEYDDGCYVMTAAGWYMMKLLPSPN